MRFLAMVAIASSCLFNVACSVDTIGSEEVNTHAIYQAYSVQYDQETDSTQLSAQFRVGGWSGTTVDLRSPADIAANGKKLSKETFLGTRYSVAERGFVEAVTFDYTDADGKHLSNAIRIDPMHLLKADQTVSVQRPYEVEIQVVNPVNEESIRVELQQTSARPDGASEHLYVQGVFDVAQGKAVFSPSELNKLNNGPATLVISRRKSTRLQQSTKEGGLISAIYNLRPVSVMIVDKMSSTVQQTLTLR